MDIESRKDKDVWFDSLAGWNADDKLGRKQQAAEKKQRRRDEKEARVALKKQRHHNSLQRKDSIRSKADD